VCIISTDHGMEDIGFPVPVKVAGQQDCGSRVARPRREFLDVKLAVTLLKPDMHVVRVLYDMNNISLAVSVEISHHHRTV